VNKQSGHIYTTVRSHAHMYVCVTTADATLGSKTDARQLYVDVVVHVIFRERLVCECVAAVAARVVDVGDGRAGATRGQHQHNGGEPRSLVAPTRKALLHHARSGEKTYFKVK